jgi:6,7-dimethyl-8-ribityllumazine synthase
VRALRPKPAGVARAAGSYDPHRMPDSTPEPAAPALPAPSLHRVAVIVSRYNGSITGKLLEGARSEYRARGGEEAGLSVYEAPGAYELPALALAAAETGRYRGVVALGCLIKGETRHDRYIAEAVAHGLMQVMLQTGVPVAFGVLTVDSPKQARARSGGEHGNKGREAMAAVLETIATGEAIGAGRGMVVVSAGLSLDGPDKARVKNGRAGKPRPAGKAG